MSARRRRNRPRLHFRRQTKPGAPPGSLVVDPAARHSTLTAVGYGPESMEVHQVQEPAQARALVGQMPVTWINVEGLGDAETLEQVARAFHIHPLAMEDVVNAHQRAKVEDYGDYLFIVVRMPVPGDEEDTEQFCLFLGKHFVISVQERSCGCLDPVHERLRHARGRIRQQGADHLAYALLDAVIDAYFPVLERCGEQLDQFDVEVATEPGRETVAKIHELRGDLLMLRRAVWPLRDAIGALAREPRELISDETRVYLRDCYDHTVQIVDLIETCREMCADLREFYLSTVNNRMSEVMKVLTVIATVFIPMSVVAGVYGMNFNTEISPWNMPELHWRYGYPFALAVMAAMGALQLVYFWRRGWLRS